MFSLARLNLAKPVMLNLPTGRPRVVAGGGQSAGAVGVIPRTFSGFDLAFAVNATTRTIHAQIAPIPTALLIYGPDDFGIVAADTPEQHVDRVKAILGGDPQAILQMLADGSQMPPIPPRVPREIPNWRAKAILYSMGLLEGVETFFSTLPEPQKTVATLAWNGDAKVERKSSTVLALAGHFGWSEMQLDQMFIAAEALVV